MQASHEALNRFTRLLFLLVELGPFVDNVSLADEVAFEELGGCFELSLFGVGQSRGGQNVFRVLAEKVD